METLISDVLYLAGMEDLLKTRILDNSLYSLLAVGAIILFALVCKRYVSRVLAKLLYKSVAKAAKGINRKSFIDLVVQPLDMFLLFLVSIIALDRLRFPSYWDFAIYRLTFKDLIESIGKGILVAMFIWLCLRIIDFAAMILKEKASEGNDQMDSQLVVFFKDFFKVILVIIGGLLILRFSFNKPIGNVFTGLSLVGAAIALATRESMENLIASFVIFFDKPFTTGDLVKVQNQTGSVEKIGLRSTRIRTSDKTFITVPNKQMVDTIIDNLTLRTQRHVEIKLELSLSTSAEKIKELLQALKIILDKTAIENQASYLTDTGRSAHIIAIDYFTAGRQALDDFNTLREAINLEIIKKLADIGIELAAASTGLVIRKAEG